MPRVDAARACALNVGISLVWGAVLGISLQERALTLAPAHDAVEDYARIFALGALVATIVQIAAGTLSDRVVRVTGSRLPFYSIGVALAIPALVWLYLAPTLLQLALAFVAVEFGMNVLCGPYQAVIPDYIVPARRGNASSWMSAYQAVGNAMGLILAGLVHEVRVVAVAIGASLAASYAVTFAHVRRATIGSFDAPAVTLSARTPHGPLVVLLCSRGLINVGFYTLLGFLLFFVRDSLRVTGDATTATTGIIFLTFTLAAIPGSVVAARPVDTIDKRLAVFVAMIVVSAALLGLVFATNVAAACGWAALAGAGWGAFVTADWALAAAVLPPGGMAASMGVWNVGTTVPQVIAPLLTAPLVTRLDAASAGAGPRAAMLLALVEFVAGAIVVWRLPRA